MLGILKKFTDSYYLRGLPFLLYKGRKFFRNKSRIYTDPDGISVFLDIDNYFQNNIQYGYYEFSVRTLFKRILKQGDCVLDIGANIGYLTTLAGTLVGPEGKVLCFEPNSGLTKIIKRNLDLNGLRNVDVYAIAAGDFDGELDLHIGTEHSLSTMIKDAPFMQLDKIETVPVRLIDSVLTETGFANRSIKLVKLDVEGFELFALRGMVELISKKRTVFLIESNPPAQKLIGTSFSEVANTFFFPHGYRIYWLESKTEQMLVGKKRIIGTLIYQENASEFDSRAGDYLALPHDFPLDLVQLNY